MFVEEPFGPEWLGPLLYVGWEVGESVLDLEVMAGTRRRWDSDEDRTALRDAIAEFAEED